MFYVAQYYKLFYICSVIKNKEIMTTLEIKVSKLENGYKVWETLSPMERYNKVMIHFSAAERKGVNGMRTMMQYIIDNNISK